MVDFSQLNPEQHQAVTRINGPVMIIAGAGTGKTRVITYRMAFMLNAGVPPSEIVAMTFTNKAAREMRERLMELVGRQAKGIIIGTFHSFCLRILREFPHEAGLDKRFSLAGTSDQLDLVRKAMEERGWQGLYRPEDLLARISSAKNALLRPQDVMVADPLRFSDKDPAVLAAIYDVYERQLKLNRVIDFDDCIFKTAWLLRNHPDLCQRLQERWRYFLVDEFQDTNFAQLYILELLAKESRNICVVGDDDQSIYSWRGALVETLDRFEQIFTGTLLIKLEQNYRCSNVILHAANTVIRNNTGRKVKTLWSSSQNQNPITLASHADDVNEAKWIAKKCFTLLGQGFKPKDIGILYRANAQAKAVEMALREMQVSYKVYGGTSFFERKEVKDFLCYFRLSVNPGDRLAFWRIINTPVRGIGLKTLEKIEEAAKAHDKSPLEVLNQDLVDLDSRARKATHEFVQAIKSLHDTPLVDVNDLEARGQRIIKEFGLEDEIRNKTTHEGARRRKIDSMKRLPTWIKTLAERQVEDRGQLQLIDLLDSLSLGDNEKDKKGGNDNHVSLMTIHASKGLEFPVVFLCGVEEDQLPHKNSVNSDQALMEERRLFYVAITRAKIKLHLTYARERFSQFKKATRKPSRFIDELPNKGVETEHDAEMRSMVEEEQKKEINISRLSKLKAELRGGFAKRDI
ncbi:MAG TPA: ATP-dependent helicase [Oligoflexus sp.]|uniref:ATP-dependent helicase n=1 Tax=Oligoflexus sp. TaxID=1971216 RepID=UPI002D26D16D|nr:ATP-dependent helicase [Oligoflexus sp.]HYX35017.1 ATP-dependent helicase [Oligoflexus sp.]